MDEENPETNGGQSTKKTKIEVKITQKNNDPESIAGPGQESPKVHKPGRSKSENSLRQIITTKDVANALKLTSMSFATTNQAIKNLNLKEVKIPLLIKDDNTERTDSDLVDLFMAGCFKLNKETPTISEGPVTIHTAISTITTEIIQENPNSSCVTTNAQTEVNEVIVTNQMEPMLSKEDKKKTSGHLSERSDLVLVQRDSLSSIGSNVCRICMTRGRERLISPCNCKGSLANVHLTCLERWLNQVGRNHCELCGFSYPAIRTPRYTVLEALRLWFGNPRNRSHLQSDCLIFWLLSTVTAGLLAVCIVGTQYFVIEGSKFGKLDAAARKEGGISQRITETAMDFFMAVVLCGYSITVYLLWKDHYVMWNRWRRANVNVRLLLTPDANPVPFVPRANYNMV